MKNNINKNALGELSGYNKRRKTRTKLKLDLTGIENYFENKRTIDNLSEIFESFFNRILDEEFQYISTIIKLKEHIQSIKHLLLKDAARKFFKSNDAKSYIKVYLEAKDIPYFNNDVYIEFSLICFRDWADTYLEPIRLMLILFLDKDSRNKELKKFGIQKAKKESGRKKDKLYNEIFPLVPMVKDRLQKDGKKSNDTEAIKYLCKKQKELSFSRKIVTAYNNRKLKSKSLLSL
jgi:hypothetical protein